MTSLAAGPTPAARPPTPQGGTKRWRRPPRSGRCRQGPPDAVPTPDPNPHLERAAPAWDRMSAPERLPRRSGADPLFPFAGTLPQPYSLPSTCTTPDPPQGERTMSMYIGEALV